jgi:pyridoxine kinase
MNILSVQSSVAYGHVGNAAAVFPLQRLGAEVWPVHTVQFSNHPGYGSHTGQVFAPDAVASLISGIEARGVFPNCDALLTGYIGDAGIGAVLRDAAARIKAANPGALWCCDPVMGDAGPGLYVRPDIPAFFRDQAVPRADILTPNQFELECLTGAPCRSLHDAKAACLALQARMPESGPRVILVTSLLLKDAPPDRVGLLCAAGGDFHRLLVPKLAFTGNGAGDALAALFLFHLLRTRSAAEALTWAASAVHAVIRRTVDAGLRELQVVQAQEELVRPSTMFAPHPCP